MIPLFYSHISPKAKQLVNQVLDSNFLNTGQLVEQFEQELVKLGLPNVITTSSCCSALQICLDLCNAKNKEVVLSPQSFLATGLAVLWAGGIPKFADIDINGNLNPETLHLFATPQTAAIICIDWGGIPCNIEEIMEIGRSLNVPIISDAAHSLFSRINGQLVGNFADYTCFSFQNIKFLSCCDGGAISTIHPEILPIAREKVWFGLDKQNIIKDLEGRRRYPIREIGYKSNLSNLHGALGLGNLEDIHQRLTKRHDIACGYLEELKNITGLRLPYIKTNISPSWWLFTIKVKNRKDFIRKMKSTGIEVSMVDGRMDRYTIFGGITPRLYGMEEFENEQISIPCHENLKLDEVDHIIQTIKSGW